MINQTLATELYYGKALDVLKAIVPPQRHVVVITDNNILRLYPTLVTSYNYIAIESGEGSKDMGCVMDIFDKLMSMGADRSTLLIGIGGGVVTDITGFVASTYMRGVEFGFVSTTLLGQVDASIGGKNGVNFQHYKNIIGTITQPRFVVSDVEMLRTLPERELRAGMAEVVKSAIVGDGELFQYLYNNTSADIYASAEMMQYVVSRAVAVKRAIVAEDERECGRRRLLNLGHTIGHAIEKCTHELNHGEAVAIGISMMAHASCRLGLLDNADAEVIDAILLKLGFRLELPLPISDILSATRQDKKKSEGDIHVVLPVAIGECEVRKMSFDEFYQLFI